MNQSERLARIGPPILSAFLLTLAFPPFNLGLLSLVALTPWLIQLRDADGRRGWRSGYLFGLVYGLGQLWWVAAFVARWTQSWPLGLLPYFAAVAAYALYFGLAGWLMTVAWRHQRAWLVPLVWAGVEVFRSYIPVFAFPWGLLASPLWPYAPLNQNAYFGSIYLVSAFCLFASTTLAMLMSGDSFQQVRPLLNALLVGVVLSLLRMGMNPDTQTYVVTIGQPGVDMAFGDRETQQAKLREAIQPMLEDAANNGTQLVVLPEGLADATTVPPKTPFVPPPELPVMYGAQRSSNPSYQSLFLADRGVTRFVDKTRLVIFGEFVPGRGIIPYPESFRLPAGDLAAGTHGVQSVDVRGLRVGPAICFEAVFPDIAYRQILNGSRLLVVPSIDDWYMGTNAPDQLRAATIWRSIESGTPVARSASTGYSLATDDHGRVIAEAPLGQPANMRVEMKVPTQVSGFRLLPIFPALCLLVTVFAVYLSRHKPRESS